jgi:hypothetical protein
MDRAVWELPLGRNISSRGGNIEGIERQNFVEDHVFPVIFGHFGMHIFQDLATGNDMGIIRRQGHPLVFARLEDFR